jgi:uncharacterized protein (UPF0218 family)
VTTTVAVLPDALRAELKEPAGPVFVDADELLDGVTGPAYAVGDVVAAHLLAAGHTPDVAVVDGRTRRGDLPEQAATALADLDPDERVANEPGTLSADLVRALAAAVDGSAPVVVEVDGEEDLATLPLVLLAPRGAVVVYGQPDEGMVRMTVDPATRETVRGLLDRFETDGLWDLL